MTLSCGCDYDYDGDAEWYYDSNNRFKPLDTKRARRCRACKTLVKRGTTVLQIARWRGPKTDMEAHILGEDAEIHLAPWYLCERCGDIYSSLTELGFCVDLTESMDAQLAEYHRDYAQPPAPGFELKIGRKP